MRRRWRSVSRPPQWGQMAWGGASAVAVMGWWVSGCWAIFIGYGIS